MSEELLLQPDDAVLVTGATGFIGARVVRNLLARGFRNVRCLARATSNRSRLLESTHDLCGDQEPEIVEGNLLSPEDCLRVTDGVKVILHLAAGTGTKSFAAAYLNSVVTTRNLLDAALKHGCLERFVNLSSFAVFTNRGKPRWGVLDEQCPVEPRPEKRAEAYCYGKVKQDELVVMYGKEHNLPYVLLRPGVVYGPGKKAITGRVGIDTFGVFLHLAGFNRIPLTYVDNCAEAVVLAGLVKGIDGETFNIVDNDLPSGWKFLRRYKKNVKRFTSLYVPHFFSYLFCWFWELYCIWSKNQLPPIFTRAEWAAYWKRTRYDNSKLRNGLGWKQPVPTPEGLNLFFEGCREG